MNGLQSDVSSKEQQNTTYIYFTAQNITNYIKNNISTHIVLSIMLAVNTCRKMNPNPLRFDRIYKNQTSPTQFQTAANVPSVKAPLDCTLVHSCTAQVSCGEHSPLTIQKTNARIVTTVSGQKLNHEEGNQSLKGLLMLMQTSETHSY